MWLFRKGEKPSPVTLSDGHTPLDMEAVTKITAKVTRRRVTHEVIGTYDLAVNDLARVPVPIPTNEVGAVFLVEYEIHYGDEVHCLDAKTARIFDDL
jgi:hypothetical protein